MAWHQKGLSKEEKAYYDFLVAQALVQIIALQKGDVSVREQREILANALELIVLSTKQ